MSMNITLVTFHKTAEKCHLARLRELDARLAACQSMEAEAQVQQLIEAENNRWTTVQQTGEKKNEH